MWAQLVAAAPRTLPTWMPSHQPLQFCLDAGYTATQWVGNRWADQEANAAAEAIRVPLQLRVERQQSLDDLIVAQRTIAAVQCAILEHARLDKPTAKRRLGRIARSRKLFARIASRPFQVRLRWYKPARAPVQAAAHTSVCAPVPAQGLPASPRRPNDDIKWTATCGKCGGAQQRTRQWARFALSPCTAAPAGSLLLTPGCHELAPEGRGFRCARCPRLRAHAARSRLPPQLTDNPALRPTRPCGPLLSSAPIGVFSISLPVVGPGGRL